jgi:hypothetical protein
MCYIVREIATRSVPRSFAGNLRTPQPLVALWSYISMEIPICTSRNVRYLQGGTTKDVR